MAGLAILRANNMRKSALRAQQITLAAAVFDKDGRILVDPDGLIPSTVLADSFLEKVCTSGTCCWITLTSLEYERRLHHGPSIIPLDVPGLEKLERYIQTD